MKRMTLRTLGLILCLVGVAVTAQAQTGAGRIQGRVLDEAENGIPDAQIMFLTNGLTIYDFTDEQGDYNALLPVGTYAVGVRLTTGEEDNVRTYTEFYDDVRFLHEATTLTLNEGQTIENIDFQVPDLANAPPAITMTISGRVTDAAGSPLANAFVMINDVRGIITPDSAITDVQGRYSVTIQDYVQRLKAWSFKPGYNLQFYDQQPSLFTATEIFVDPDNPVVSGIDFVLEESTNGNTGNSIQGRVTSDAGFPVSEALVVGFNTETEEVRYALSNFQGRYTITGLDGGSYYVLFLASGLAPQFFGNTLRWQEAELVNVEGTTFDVDARLGGLNRPPIGGRTRTNSTGGESNFTGVVQRFDDNSPIGNTLITIYDAEDKIVGFDLTDPQGVFEILDTEPGTFTVKANRIQFDDAEATMTVEDVEFFAQTFINLTLTASMATDVEADDTPGSFHLGQNYPNPFNPETVIRYTLPQAAHVTLTIYDVLGREVTTLVDGPQTAGTTTVRFEAPGILPSGVYYYRLEAGTLSRTGRMVLVR